jgi:two-component system nitrogen regulation sensor histidine kinase NtrY
MDALTERIAEAPLPRPGRLALVRIAEIAVLILALATPVMTYVFVDRYAHKQLFSPPMAALLLLVNLLPYVALIVLIGRRIAIHRAARSALAGGGRLHVRLVAVFTLMASIPIVLTVIAASVMFQSGVQLWGSERARSVFNATQSFGEQGQRVVIERWTGEARTMADDIAGKFPTLPLRSPDVQDYLLRQTYNRNLFQFVLFRVENEKNVTALYSYDAPKTDVFAARVSGQVLNILRDRDSYTNFDADTLWVVTPVDRSRNLFLYVATPNNVDFLNRQNLAADKIVAEFDALQSRSRSLQLQFNVVLFGVALLIVGLATWIALTVADRLVRPVDQLVTAARRIAEGDLTARVPTPQIQDEIGTLGVAFNSMTGRLQEQTNALVSANAQLESRRALIEAVMSGVSAGVISIDVRPQRAPHQRIRDGAAASERDRARSASRSRRYRPRTRRHCWTRDDREAMVQLTTSMARHARSRSRSRRTKGARCSPSTT